MEDNSNSSVGNCLAAIYLGGFVIGAGIVFGPALLAVAVPVATYLWHTRYPFQSLLSIKYSML